MNHPKFYLTSNGNFAAFVSRGEVGPIAEFRTSWIPKELRALLGNTPIEKERHANDVIEIEALTQSLDVVTSRIEDAFWPILATRAQNEIIDRLVGFGNQTRDSTIRDLESHFGSLDKHVIGFDPNDTDVLIEKNRHNLGQHVELLSITLGSLSGVAVLFFNCTWDSEHGIAITVSINKGIEILQGDVYNDASGDLEILRKMNPRANQ